MNQKNNESLPMVQKVLCKKCVFRHETNKCYKDTDTVFDPIDGTKCISGGIISCWKKNCNLDCADFEEVKGFWNRIKHFWRNL